MKKIYSALIVLTLTLMCSCTQYNGHIGPLFGSWSLVEMTADGLPLELTDESVFSFQNEVVRVVRLVDPPYTPHTVSSRYGNFTHEGDRLILKFQATPTPTGGPQYMAPDWLGFPPDENIIDFKVDRLTGSEMRLSLSSEGKNLVYFFKKTW